MRFAVPLDMGVVPTVNAPERADAAVQVVTPEPFVVKT